MAAARKESIEQKAVRFQQVSCQLAQKSDFTQCLSVMKDEPAALAAVKACLTNLGYLSGNAAPRTPASPAAPSGTMGVASPASMGTPKAKKGAGAVEEFPDDAPAPRSPGAASPKFLQYLLSRLEPVALSLHAQNGLKRSGQRNVPKNMLLELLTFLVDQDDDADWSGTAVGALISQLERLNQANGRRGRELQMPIKWECCGHYLLEMRDGVLCLGNRYSDQRLPLVGTFAGLGLSDVGLSKNFSLKQAGLSRPGVLHSVPCLQLLPLGAGSLQAALAAEAHSPAVLAKSGSRSSPTLTAETGSSPSPADTAGADDSLSWAGTPTPRKRRCFSPPDVPPWKHLRNQVVSDAASVGWSCLVREQYVPEHVEQDVNPDDI